MPRSAIEQEVLQLPLKERAALASLLLESLDESNGEDSSELWLEEAERRAAEIDQGKVQLVSSEEFEAKAQALFK